MITILIPTIDRPPMLRTALRSIAGQSAVSKISRVVVSENTGAQKTKDVCAEFEKLLPIDYRWQPRQLTPTEHDHLLATQLPAEGLVAILHDDDWWAPDHLGASLRRLERHPQAVASYSSYFHVAGESSRLGCDSNLMLWFGAGYPALAEEWLLSETNVLLGSLWGTPGVFSTLLARSAAYKSAAFVYQAGNPFDNDRLLTLALARQGPIAFGPVPEIFVRAHPTQGQRRFTESQRDGFVRSTLERICAQATEAKIDLREGIALRLRACPPAAREAVLAALSRSHCEELLRARQLAPDELVAYAAAHAPRARNLGFYLGRLLPPILLDAASNCRARFFPRDRPAHSPPQT